MVYSWFYGVDLAIEVVSTIILAIMVSKAISFTRIQGNGKYWVLSWSFIALAIAYLLKLGAHVLVYQGAEYGSLVGSIILAHISVSTALVSWTIFAYRILFLIGLYLLYNVYVNKQQTSLHVLFIYMLFVNAVLARYAYYIFNLTAVVILTASIFGLYRKYCAVYDCKRVLLLISFMALAASHLVFIFISLWDALYILAEFIQLVSFALLMAAIIMVRKDAKKGQN